MEGIFLTHYVSRGILMVRRNGKQQVINYENSIRKSNELSMAKLNKGLTLNQMQLLAYAIYSTQQDGKTEFIKADFEKKFGLEKYQTKDAYIDSDKISALRFSTQNLEEKKFRFVNVFSFIDYDNGNFTFKWNPDFIPHILELKSYSLIDLTITSKFRSSFSWTLYEYLKGHFANWYKELSKEALMKLFNVEDRMTYIKSTAQFKRGVLDVAIDEVNQYSEYDVWYTEKKVGNKITGFVIHWSTGKTPPSATEQQLNLLREINSEVEKNMFDYLSLKDVDSLDQARKYIIAIRDIHQELNNGLSAEKADKYIQESLFNYKKLEALLENEGKKRDTSFYYNWLEDDGNV